MTTGTERLSASVVVKEPEAQQLSSSIPKLDNGLGAQALITGRDEPVEGLQTIASAEPPPVLDSPFIVRRGESDPSKVGAPGPNGAAVGAEAQLDRTAAGSSLVAEPAVVDQPLSPADTAIRAEPPTILTGAPPSVGPTLAAAVATENAPSPPAEATPTADPPDEPFKLDEQTLRAMGEGVGVKQLIPQSNSGQPDTRQYGDAMYASGSGQAGEQVQLVGYIGRSETDGQKYVAIRAANGDVRPVPESAVTFPPTVAERAPLQQQATENAARRQELISKQDKTPEEIRELNNLNTEANRQKRQEELEAKQNNGDALSEDEVEELIDLVTEKEAEDLPDVESKSQDEIDAENEDELKKLDTSWREIAGKGDNPGEAMIAYMQKEAEIGGEPIPEKDISELRRFMKDVYKEGGKLNLESKNSAEIKKKFVELGQLEAQIIALKTLVKEMKAKADGMKDKVDALENSYISEDDPAQRLLKLNAWRTSALQLEGYQLAVNDQAARGRQVNIDRRNAAGFIHRKLGTKGLIGNVLYGSRTAIYELSDTFQDISIDHVRNNFGFA